MEAKHILDLLRNVLLTRLSEWIPIGAGMPQGSFLWPLTFIILIITYVLAA